MEKTEDAERREKNLQEAKKIVVEEDKSLPAPLTVSSTSDLSWDGLFLVHIYFG